MPSWGLSPPPQKPGTRAPLQAEMQILQSCVPHPRPPDLVVGSRLNSSHGPRHLPQYRLGGALGARALLPQEKTGVDRVRSEATRPCHR